ncbi:hypothetical protein AHAS_Ahas19G0383300 [Arachis hypogaea]
MNFRFFFYPFSSAFFLFAMSLRFFLRLLFSVFFHITMNLLFFFYPLSIYLFPPRDVPMLLLLPTVICLLSQRLHDLLF